MFFDFFLIGFVLAFIVNDWHLTYGQSAMILLASGISAPFGSLVWGWLADKIGRRKVMIATVLNFSLATGAMALTPDGAWFYLVICRFIVGFGVTGLYSVDITLVQEFVPAAKRGWLTGLTTTMLPVGVLLGAFLAAMRRPISAGADCSRSDCCPLADALYPRLGAGVAALADAHGTARGGASLARLGLAGRSAIDPAADRRAGRRAHPLDRTVQVSAQPHRRMPHRPDADRRGRARPVDGDAVRDGAAGLAARGIEAGDLGQLAAVAGRFFCSWISDAMGRRASGVVSCLVAAVFMSLAGYLNSVFIGGISMFFLMIVLQNFFGSGNYSIVGPYMGELWPSRLRGSGMGLVYGVGNLGKFIGPAGLALIAGSANYVAPKATLDALIPAFNYFAFWYVLGAAAFWWIGFETGGRSIEEIDAALSAPASSSEGMAAVRTSR